MQDPELPGRLLTTREVAERFHVSTWTVRRWVADGKIPALKLSDRFLRFRPEDIARVRAEGVPAEAYDRIADVMVREAESQREEPAALEVGSG